MPDLHKDSLTALCKNGREIAAKEDIWVFEKPAGILSHPNTSGAVEKDVLFRAPYNRKDECFMLPSGRLFLIHRLDRETSGLILCSPVEDTAARLKELFLSKEVQKEYRALVHGVPKPAESLWSNRLEKGGRNHRTPVRVTRGAPNAFTRYRILKSYPASRSTYLAVFPDTGRTHQIRVQAAERGCAILGDRTYGDFSANRVFSKSHGLNRMFLHALRISLRHPTTGRTVSFESPLPEKLESVLEKLGAYSGR